MSGGSRTIRVRIERLVLDGVALRPGERDKLRAAIEAELGRLLHAEGIGSHLATGGAHGRLAGGTLRLPPDRGAGALAGGIARSIFAGIGPLGAPGGATGAGR